MRVSNAQAILAGLSPSDNRNVPPLHREWVYALARDFPHLRFSLNGKVRDDSHTPAQVVSRSLCGGPGGGRVLTYCMEEPWANVLDRR